MEQLGKHGWPWRQLEDEVAQLGRGRRTGRRQTGTGNRGVRRGQRGGAGADVSPSWNGRKRSRHGTPPEPPRAKAMQSLPMRWPSNPGSVPVRRLMGIAAAAVRSTALSKVWVKNRGRILTPGTRWHLLGAPGGSSGGATSASCPLGTIPTEGTCSRRQTSAAGHSFVRSLV